MLTLSTSVCLVLSSHIPGFLAIAMYSKFDSSSIIVQVTDSIKDTVTALDIQFHILIRTSGNSRFVTSCCPTLILRFSKYRYNFYFRVSIPQCCFYLQVPLSICRSNRCQKNQNILLPLFSFYCTHSLSVCSGSYWSNGVLSCNYRHQYTYTELTTIFSPSHLINQCFELLLLNMFVLSLSLPEVDVLIKN